MLPDAPARRQPGADQSERLLLGRLIETAPGWLPRIPGGPRPSRARRRRRAPSPQESAPELTNGFTMRTRYNLIAARDAGIRPVVVTSLGFPRSLGVSPVPRVVELDGIPTTVSTSARGIRPSGRSTRCWRTRRG
jgi:hypothetical protein